MVTYQDEDFVPLTEKYTYGEIGQYPQFMYGKHVVGNGWLKCPCKPIMNDRKNVDIKYAWTLEFHRKEYKDGADTICYRHQTPIAVASQLYDPNEHIFRTMSITFDDSGYLTKTTIDTWNKFIKVQWKKNTKWCFKKVSVNKIKSYYLVNRETKSQYEYRPGITLDISDMMLEQL